MTTPDRYAKQIDYLVQNPEQIEDAWLEADHLFRWVTTPEATHALSCGGCLTMLKLSPERGAWMPRPLFQALMDDPRIPDTCLDNAEFAELSEEQRRNYLQPFAEWQRRLDRELVRTDSGAYDDNDDNDDDDD